MRITLEPSIKDIGYYTVTVSLPEDGLHISEAVELCKQALLAWGYHPDNIDEFINDK